MNRGIYSLCHMKTIHFCFGLKTSQNVVRCCVENITFSIRRKYCQCQCYSGRSALNFHNALNNCDKNVIRNYTQQPPRSSVSSSTRLPKQVVLYTNEKIKFLKLVNLFGLSFATFWLFTSYQFATMRITPVAQRNAANLPWYARFDMVSSPIRKTVAAVISAIVGCAVFGGAWMYSVRSVGKVILEKSGKTATFVTYNPLTFSMSKTVTANLGEISCQGHRSMNDVVPIKVKGKWMHFLLSKEGVYHNGPLFDRSVGLKRTF